MKWLATSLFFLNWRLWSECFDDDDDDRLVSLEGNVLRFSWMVLSRALEKLTPVMLRVFSSSIFRRTYWFFCIGLQSISNLWSEGGYSIGFAYCKLYIRYCVWYIMCANIIWLYVPCVHSCYCSQYSGYKLTQITIISTHLQTCQCQFLKFIQWQFIMRWARIEVQLQPSSGRFSTNA